MKSAVIVFPGSNRDRDMIAALTKIPVTAPAVVWHKDTELPKVDLIVIPGGFSYGDYLRSGAIAARSPIMDAVRAEAARGVKVLGVCNGFQILTEAGLLPGVLMRNASLRFVCREVKLSVANAATAFTRGYTEGQVIRCPSPTRRQLLHRSRDAAPSRTTARSPSAMPRAPTPTARSTTSPASSTRDKNVLGLMPHPENLIETAHGGTRRPRPILRAVAGRLTGSFMTLRFWYALFAIAIGVVGISLDFSVMSSALVVSADNPVARSLPDMLVYFWTFLTHLSNLGLILVYLADLTRWRWLGWFRDPVTRQASPASSRW